MKLFSILFLALSFSAQAANYCDSPEVKSGMSEGEECRPLVKTSEIESFQKICKGSLMGVFDCHVIMVAIPEGKGMNVTCSGPDGKEVLNQDLEAEISAFNQSAVVTSVAGDDRLIMDPKTYTVASGAFVDVLFDGEAAVIGMTLNKRMELTEVTCQ